jgi:hypothetical protein
MENGAMFATITYIYKSIYVHIKNCESYKVKTTYNLLWMVYYCLIPLTNIIKLLSTGCLCP